LSLAVAVEAELAGAGAVLVDLERLLIWQLRLAQLTP
jgi:hypothetical protein